MVESSEEPAFRMMLPLTLHPLMAATSLMPDTGALSMILFAIIKFSAVCPTVDHQPMPIEALLAGRGVRSRSKVITLFDMMTFAIGMLAFGSNAIPAESWLSWC